MFTTLTVKGKEFRVYPHELSMDDYIAVRREGFDTADDLLYTGEFAGTEIVEIFNSERKAGRENTIFVKVN